MRRGWMILAAGVLIPVGIARTETRGAPLAGPAAKTGAMSMEFSVTETEADGRRRVIAAPRVITRPGQPAKVTVRTDDGGLDLNVKPTRLPGGRIRLGVSCKAWRESPDKAGKPARTTRRIRHEVIVAEGSRVELKSPEPHPMTLELAIRSL